MKKKAPRFYCESCGKQVPADVDSCPHCGMPFYAVRCPRCGYTDNAMKFVGGCPSCGYLGAASEGATPEGREGQQDVFSRAPKSNLGRAPGSKKKRAGGSPGGEMPGWMFFIILLLLGTLLAGLVISYLNIL